MYNWCSTPKGKEKMVKRIISILLVLAAIFVLAGCSTAQPLPETEDSTFIKNPKKISEYLKKEDYKSIAYAYLYNTKEGAKSYKISRSGTLNGKVLFIDYEIEISLRKAPHTTESMIPFPPSQQFTVNST